MKKIMLMMALLFTVSCDSAEANPTLSVKEQVEKSFIRPAERCLNGVVYYVVRTAVAQFDKGYGYGFLAPKIDSATLQYVRCRKENNTIIQEL